MEDQTLAHLKQAERELEGKIAELEAALSSVRQAIGAVAGGALVKGAQNGTYVRTAAVPGSRGGLSRLEGHYDHIIYRGKIFEGSGKFLDEVGEPHYFSRVNGGRSDASQRQIFRWARRNPHEASDVTLVRRDGTEQRLSDFMREHGKV